MKLWKTIIVTISLIVLGGTCAWAIVDFNQQSNSRNITLTGFTDFPPFGETLYKESRRGIELDRTDNPIFQAFIEDFAKDHNMFLNYQYNDKDYTASVRQVRAGSIDVILGMYYGTKLYEGLDIIIPAVTNNPITLITLPEKSKSIKNLNDLKKMKGGMLEKEHLSDYVIAELKNFDIEKVADPYEMYRMLFTGEIDYIFSSYYNGVIETSKLGLRNKVTFSKQSIWDMPLFIGISKASPNHKYLSNRLTNYVDNEENIKKFKKLLDAEIARRELEGQYVVPPIFINE